MEGRIMGAFLWGSHATGRAHGASDVDVCLVAGPARDPGEIQHLAWRHVRAPDLQLDVRVFEDLPRYLQGAVLDADRLLWAEDRLRLYEYLYPFRKRWADEAARSRVSEEDLRRAIARPAWRSKG